MPASDYELFEVYEDFGGNEGPTAGHFQEFLHIYREMQISQDDPEDDEDLFYQFLNTFVPDTEPHDAAWWREQRRLFYNLSGATDEDVDWIAYRAAIDTPI